MLVCKAMCLIVFVRHHTFMCRSCHNVRFLLNILIERCVATLDLCIISCWFGCSQDVSFVLCLNICLNVWGSWGRCFSADSVLICRTRVGALTWWARYSLDSFGSTCLSLLVMAFVILVCYDLVFAIPWFVTAPRCCWLCSTSLPGGNQVDGLPPAPSRNCEAMLIFLEFYGLWAWSTSPPSRN